ncbi:hypothetical protein QYM36_002763 [Artemia franciscana]|uniref:Glutathione synthetase n=2 Tax=Artemia franciscana TaxID=6661 RepID=A0AA88I1V0_ARTSF|nr:hypothetical protein QYM36_002763 [Artemia franciscana]
MDWSTSINDTVFDKARMWALINGITCKGPTSTSLRHAPFLLFPSIFPANSFNKALQIQSTIGEVIHKVSRDSEFLLEVLKSTIEVDDFTRKLYEVYKIVLNEGVAQEISLGILRTDYMLNKHNSNIGVSQTTEEELKMIEINTIASSFAGLASQFPDFRRYILNITGHTNLIPQIPDNAPLKGIAEGLIAAWSLYGNPSAVILMVVEDIPNNIADQMHHEFAVKKLKPEVDFVICSLSKLHQYIKLSHSNKNLYFEGVEVSVVYYRAGYEPDHYSCDSDWESRLLIERSNAIKCPSINLHLAGTKKVQQELARPGVLERYLQDANMVKEIQETFVGIYSLDLTEEGDLAAAMAIKNPERYVLKPQREGGGNNVYGKDVASTLLKLCCLKERAAYILMELIKAPARNNVMLRPESDKPIVGPMVSELGVYGVTIGSLWSKVLEMAFKIGKERYLER